MSEEPESGCDIFWLLPAPDEGALFLEEEMAMAANAHPMMVPANTQSCVHSHKSVVKWTPMSFGSRFPPRKERLQMMLVDAVSVSVGV